MPLVPIKSFADKRTEAAFRGELLKGFPSDLLRVAQRKLTMVNSAATLDDLRIPPANRLEKLVGKRARQHSIRVNDQFRVCFRWDNGHAYEVEFVDYHKE
jgi:proteic killer suppression protein